MVNKITKRRLKSFLYYDLWKVLLSCVLVCAILLLVFNFVARKPTDGQDFKLLISGSVTMGTDDSNALFENLFTKKPTEGGFSYEMLNGNTVYMFGTDENPEEHLLKGIYSELYYDDVVILQEELYVKYIQANMATDINKYIADAKEFVADEAKVITDGKVDKQKAYDYFDRTRKRDSRFRTKSEKAQGRIYEFERLEGLWNMANALENCFKLYPDLLDKERTINVFGKEQKGVYALKLGSLTGKEKEGKKISNLFSVAETTNENGEEKVTHSANGIYLAIGNNKKENGDLYYEMLAVLYTLINDYTEYL